MNENICASDPHRKCTDCGEVGSEWVARAGWWEKGDHAGVLGECRGMGARISGVVQAGFGVDTFGVNGKL